MHDLATSQSLTGQEPHGLNVEPGFADAGSGDYRLDHVSDLIDSGVLIPGINDDYAGTAPDIGASEYQGYGFTLTTDPTSCAVAPGSAATYIIGVQPVGGFSGTVVLTAASPSPSLALTLRLAAIALGGVATCSLASFFLLTPSTI